MPALAIPRHAMEKAQAGTIETPVLEICRRAAHDLRTGTVSEAEGHLLVLCMGPLLDELAGYRARAAEACELSPALPDNVVQLRGDA